MAFSPPPFLRSLLRPFTTSRLSLSPEGSTTQARPIPAGHHLATVAAGCFWGVEHEYRKHFGPLLHDVRVGYIGGDVTSPSYRAVCSGSTGHAEAAQITFDPEKVSYRTLIEFFYKMHDPTTKNRQGNDSGTQYRSAVFWHDAEQEKVAREVTEAVDREWWGPGKVVTEVLEAGRWWDAEDYHQEYLIKNPYGYVCASHHVRKFPDLKYGK